MFKPLSVFNRHRNTPALRDDASGDSFVQLHQEMNRLFDDFFADFGTPSLFSGDQRKDTRPVHIEYKDTGKSLELEAELPGVEEEDIDVELYENLLTIRGEKKIEEDDKDNEGVTRRSWSSFQRTMSLPFDIEPDAVSAKFKNGVLKLSLPKPPELERSPRKIAIERD